ncbi:unnamed protein product [Parnassius mnemosyne]|uniref:Reverse transcriptase domain-containing protein n=1 Tax=Parnassius mnemosyne TaxID=213953 RepID=A0AAV1KHV3_9NEOP
MSRAGSVSQCVEGGEAGPAQEGGAPRGLTVRVPALVLLDEAGKLFERIIADRLVSHLSREGPDLDDNQFGFRRGRSTIDAITRVRALAEDTVSRGGVVLAVSLDISNAFNTLPWSCIREALNYHRVPPYLRRTIWGLP